MTATHACEPCLIALHWLPGETGRQAAGAQGESPDMMQRILAGLRPVAASLLIASLAALPATGWAASACATPGQDGSVTTASPTMVYMTPTASVASGATSITVSSATGVAAGNLLLVIQMQGAGINYTNTANYGDGTSGTGSGYLTTGLTAGTYEYAAVKSVAGGTITLSSGLVNAYTKAAASSTAGASTYQVIRVPQYINLTLNGTVTVTPWNGSTGGVLPLDVAGTFAFASKTISADYAGFRGGGAQMLDGSTATGTGTDYVNLANTTSTVFPAGTTAVTGFHASKGEGIAGTPYYTYNETAGTESNQGSDGLPSGSFARGAPGNAGGGGTDADPAANDDNSGGGGGGNGGAGAQGGNSWNADTAVGGKGGAVFAQGLTSGGSKIVMGGGGGAGSRNNSTGYESSGGQGGGIVIVRASNITAPGTISAGGGTGPAPANDGGGGGGAGGTILVLANTQTGTLTLNAIGGAGASDCSGCTPASSNLHGPGGGGGGGLIYTSSNVLATPNVSQGASGVTADGTNYGATAGGGVLGGNLATTSVTATGGSPFSCLEPTLTLLKSANSTSVAPGSTVTYTLTVTNTGSIAAYSVVLSDAMPPFQEMQFVPNAYGTGGTGTTNNFKFTDGSTPSGMTMGTATYSPNSGAYVNIPTTAGWQTTMTNFKIPMTGNMPVGSSFTIQYQATVH